MRKNRHAALVADQPATSPSASGHFSRRLILGAVLAASVATLAACDSGQPAVSVETRLPVSINEVMVSQINHAADPFWQFAWGEPESDRDWRELERLAYQVQVGAAMIKVPGTGPMDKVWTDSREWQQHAERLNQDGARAVAAVRSRDMGRVEQAGFQLMDTCEACHRDFRPDLPAMREFGDLPALPPVSY